MPRKIWVSTTAFMGRFGTTLWDNLNRAGEIIDRAALDHPDIICLPENFACKGLPQSPAELAESIPGPSSEMVSARARKHNANIICPLMEKRGDVLYNVAAVIDRKGQIVGTYEKLHPVTTTPEFTEFEGGVTPGKEPKVFDLDFGRIGILICFDILWAADFARLAEMGAEIVFWPADAGGGFPLRARAWDNHYFVVSSSTGLTSCIIDIDGEILDQTGPWTPVTSVEIDLEKKFLSTGFNASRIPEI
jgi:predicted amidohydrolase